MGHPPRRPRRPFPQQAGRSGPVRVNVTAQHLGPTSEPTLGDLGEALIAVYGTDYGIYSPTCRSHRRVDSAGPICGLGGDLTQLGLADALTTWFGPPTAA
jgi:hypothetical protein